MKRTNALVVTPGLLQRNVFRYDIHDVQTCLDLVYHSHAVGRTRSLSACNPWSPQLPASIDCAPLRIRMRLTSTAWSVVHVKYTQHAAFGQSDPASYPVGRGPAPWQGGWRWGFYIIYVIIEAVCDTRDHLEADQPGETLG